jgi:hypothetical protein
LKDPAVIIALAYELHLFRIDMLIAIILVTLLAAGYEVLVFCRRKYETTLLRRGLPFRNNDSPRGSEYESSSLLRNDRLMMPFKRYYTFFSYFWLIMLHYLQNSFQSTTIEIGALWDSDLLCIYAYVALYDV